MSLLREIQDASINSQTDLETLLRKCSVLATRLKCTDFKLWIQSELDGYPDEAELPDYRQLRSQAYGNFTGKHGSRIDHARIPDEYLPEELRADLLTRSMNESVSTLFAMIKNCEQATLKMKWPNEVLAAFGGGIYQDMQLVEGWLSITQSMLIGLVQTVRNRILNFVLEVESQDAAADTSERSLSDEELTQTFYHFIFNASKRVQTNHQMADAVQEHVHEGDFESLGSYLKDLGFNQSDVNALREAVANDNPPIENRFESHTAEWIGEGVAKVAAGNTKIAISSASQVLAEAVKAYYGCR